METKEKQKYYKEYLEQKKNLRAFHKNLGKTKKSREILDIVGVGGRNKNER